MTTTAEKTEMAPAKAAISLANLKHALKVVGAAIQRTATIPVLQCVRMEQLPTGFALEATDLDVSIRATVAESNGFEKPTVMPAEKLIAWAKLLTGDEVKLSTTDRRATVQCGRSRAVLPIVDAKTFPTLDFVSGADAITLKQADLARALRFAQIAVSQEESRYTLNGILLQANGTTLRLVATDGHRMMVYSRPCEEKIGDTLLPSRFVKVLLPLLESADGGVDLSLDANKILASIAAAMPVHVASRKMTGTFPNWQAVIPKGQDTTITVDAAALLSSLERCYLLANENGAVRITFGESIEIVGASSQDGEATETVDCAGGPAEPQLIGMNAAYLIEVLKRLSGEIQIALPTAVSATSALLLKATPHDGETLDYVVMPMRV